MKLRILMFIAIFLPSMAFAQMADNEKQSGNAPTNIIANQAAIQNDNAIKVAAASPDLKTEDVGLASPGMGSKLSDLTKK